MQERRLDQLTKALARPVGRRCGSFAWRRCFLGEPAVRMMQCTALVGAATA